jgi:predicted metal-binding transcription factor (methanogenesis marker protein 9)
MKATDLNINLIETYFGLLKNLSADSKLELIAKLSNSMKSTKRTKDDSLKSLYGAFISKQSADEIINDIKQARTFNRNRAAF